MRPQLRVIDTATGEVQEPSCAHIETCEHCSERESAFDVLQRKYVGALSEIGRLKADPEAEARKHAMWDEAEAVFDWWRLATHHEGAKWSADRFWEVLPRLKERGPVGVLKVICGLAYDPNTSRMRNGGIKRHDGFHLVCESGPKSDERAERVPGPDSEHEWKRWLLQRIESNLHA